MVFILVFLKLTKKFKTSNRYIKVLMIKNLNESILRTNIFEICRLLSLVYYFHE